MGKHGGTLCQGDAARVSVVLAPVQPINKVAQHEQVVELVEVHSLQGSVTDIYQ